MDTLPTSHKLFHSFCTMPNTRFEAQQPDETVYLVIRAHPITQIFTFVNAFFFVFLVFFANFFLPSVLTLSQIVFTDIFAVVLIFNYVWFHIMNWYFNVGVITNKQIMDLDFHLVLYKQVTYTQLTHVEDVTAKSGGFFESFFNFGNLFIQTAGTEINTEFLNIPDPSGVAKIINGLLEHHVKRMQDI